MQSSSSSYSDYSDSDSSEPETEPDTESETELEAEYGTEPQAEEGKVEKVEEEEEKAGGVEHAPEKLTQVPFAGALKAEPEAEAETNTEGYEPAVSPLSPGSRAPPAIITSPHHGSHWEHYEDSRVLEQIDLHAHSDHVAHRRRSQEGAERN